MNLFFRLLILTGLLSLIAGVVVLQNKLNRLEHDSAERESIFRLSIRRSIAGYTIPGVIEFAGFRPAAIDPEIESIVFFDVNISKQEVYALIGDARKPSQIYTYYKILQRIDDGSHEFIKVTQELSARLSHPNPNGDVETEYLVALHRLLEK